MRNFWIALAGVGFVTLLRLTGMIGNLWFGLVVLASIGILAIINSIQVEKLNKAAIAFLVLMGLLGGGAALYGFLNDAAPYTAVALDRRAHMADMVSAEIANAPGLYGLASYRDMISEIDDVAGRNLRMRCDYVTYRYTQGLMSTADMQDEVRLIGEEAKRIADSREAAGKVIVDAQPQLQNWLASISSATAQVILWCCGLLLVVAAIGSMFTPKPVFKTALGVVALVALLFGGNYLLTTGSAGATQLFSGSGGPMSNVITITIPPGGQLSQVVHLPNNKSFDWTVPGNVEFVLPNGRVIKVANGNTTFKLGTINDFRLRGDPGQATFTIL